MTQYWFSPFIGMIQSFPCWNTNTANTIKWKDTAPGFFDWKDPKFRGHTLFLCVGEERCKWGLTGQWQHWEHWQNSSKQKYTKYQIQIHPHQTPIKPFLSYFLYNSGANIASFIILTILSLSLQYSNDWLHSFISSRILGIAFFYWKANLRWKIWMFTVCFKRNTNHSEQRGWHKSKVNLRDFGNILQARNIERKSYLGARINAFTASTIFIIFYIFTLYNNDHDGGNSSDGVTRAAQRWTFDKCSSLSQSVFFVMLTLGPVFQVGANLKKWIY